MRNNKIGENSCDIVFIIFWQNNTKPKDVFLLKSGIKSAGK